MNKIALSLLIFINSFYASNSLYKQSDSFVPTILSEKEHFNPASVIQPLDNKTESETLEYIIDQIGKNEWPLLIFDCYDLKITNNPTRLYFKQNIELEKICDGLSWIAQEVKRRYPDNSFAQIFAINCTKGHLLLTKLHMKACYFQTFDVQDKKDIEKIYNYFISNTKPEIREPLNTFKERINAYYNKNFTNIIHILDENLLTLKQSADEFFSKKVPDLKTLDAQSTQKEKLEKIEKAHQEHIEQLKHKITVMKSLDYDLQQSLEKNIEKIIVQDTINNDSQKINPKNHLFRLLKICTWLSISAILIQIYFWTY